MLVQGATGRQIGQIASSCVGTNRRIKIKWLTLAMTNIIKRQRTLSLPVPKKCPTESTLPCLLPKCTCSVPVVILDPRASKWLMLVTAHTDIHQRKERQDYHQRNSILLQEGRTWWCRHHHQELAQSNSMTIWQQDFEQVNVALNISLLCHPYS